MFTTEALSVVTLVLTPLIELLSVVTMLLADVTVRNVPLVRAESAFILLFVYAVAALYVLALICPTKVLLAALLYVQAERPVLSALTSLFIEVTLAELANDHLLVVPPVAFNKSLPVLPLIS